MSLREMINVFFLLENSVDYLKRSCVVYVCLYLCFLFQVTLVDAAAKTGVNAILREISKRRGTIVNVEGDGERAEMVRVYARMPLAELTGIASTIRTITSGLGDIHMQLEGYDHVSEQAQAFIKSRMMSSHR